MKFVRKFIAFSLLLVVVLFLPLSIFLRNAEEVLFSPEQITGLIDYHIVTTDIIDETLKNMMMPVISETGFISPFGDQINNAWKALDEAEWEAITQLAVSENDISSIANYLVNNLSEWLDSEESVPQIAIDLQALKDHATLSSAAATDVLLMAQQECSPEQTEMLEPTEPTVEADITDMVTRISTAYEITILNSNTVTEYVLDEISVGAMGDALLSSNLSKPSCFAIVGCTLPPASKTVCKFEASRNDFLELIQQTLSISTTRVEPETLPLCLPQKIVYDKMAELLVPVTSEIINNSSGTLPDEVDLTANISQRELLTTKEYIQQGRQIATYGWMILLAVLIVGALLGSDLFEGFLAWLGWPLLLAGSVMLGIILNIEIIRAMIWTLILPTFRQGFPEFLVAPVKALYSELFGLIFVPGLLQSYIVIGVGVLFLVLAFVLGKKNSKEIED